MNSSIIRIKCKQCGIPIPLGTRRIKIYCNNCIVKRKQAKYKENYQKRYVKKTKKIEKIVGMLFAADFTLDEICKEVDSPKKSVMAMMSSLRNDGIVIKKKIVYSLEVSP